MSNCNTYKTDDQPWNRIVNPVTFDRPWSRVERNCSDTSSTTNNPNPATIKNSARLTKRQLYARIAKGHGPYRQKSWATQSMGFKTDSNKYNLQENGNTLLCPGN